MFGVNVWFSARRPWARSRLPFPRASGESVALFVVGYGKSASIAAQALASSTSYRLSGKAMARTGLRMMPTFPSPPLKFRTAGFPPYGFKAGLSEGAFPVRRPIVAPSWFASLLRAPRFQTCLSPLGVGAVVRLSAAIRATVVALPHSLDHQLASLHYPGTLISPFHSLTSDSVRMCA